MTLRDAIAADAAALTAIMRDSPAYAGAYQAIIRDYPVTTVMIARGVVRVAEADGLALGFYVLAPDDAELDLMFVAASAQGRGIGKTLFEDMLAAAAQAGLATVRIVAHPPAADFYRRMGARDVGIRPPSGKAGWSRPILACPVGGQ